MKVLTLDFWETLYKHRGTAEFRAKERQRLLLDYCTRSGLAEPQRLALTAFDVVDGFIKASWKHGVCPLPELVLEHATAYYQNQYSAETITGVIEEINHIYTAILKPDLFMGAAEFLTWAQLEMPLYLISDTYTIRGVTLDAVLNADGLLGLFKGRFYSDAVGFEKPNVEAMRQIISSEHVNPTEVIHVGDLVDRDYELARRVGCRCILIRHKESVLPMDLDNRVLISVCNSFTEVRRVLEENE
ncbi:MAG TPA: HAD family hydrolase [Pyrinomonadaceae bacterium]|jgi:FMN phosphatase YigB (HAD superfamily)|nr:HAD family hydrolase [Pyrinomonadaceae bacterium]